MDDKRAPLLEPTHRKGASVWAATVSLVKTCVGTGVLALPYAFSHGGALSVPGMLALGLWNWWTSMQLLLVREALSSQACLDVNERSAYSAIVCSAFGRRGMHLLDSCMGVMLLGVCCALQIQAVELMYTVSGLPWYACSLVSSCLLAPLVAQRSLARLSLVSVAGLTVLAIGLMAVLCHGWLKYGWPSRVPSEALSAPKMAGFAQFFGIAAFSFGLQNVLLPVQDGMSDPVRAPEALLRAIVVVVLAYVLVGVMLSTLFCSASTGGPEQLIILNLPRPSTVASLVQTSSAAVALLSYPMPLMPLVELVVNLSSHSCHGPQLGHVKECEPTSVRANLSARFGTLCVTSTAALTLRSFGALAGFVGCLGLVTANLLPPLLHLKLCSWPRLSTAHTIRSTAAVWVLLDSVLVLIGCLAFAYFSALTGAQMIAAGDPGT